MKIQRPSYEIWLQKPGELGIYQQIERAGRVCYKSENNTTVNSAKPFVDRMVQSEHFAMLEHGTVSGMQTWRVAVALYPQQVLTSENFRRQRLYYNQSPSIGRKQSDG